MSATTIQPLESSHAPSGGASPESRGIALRAIQGEGVPTYVVLGALRLDERNVRKDPPTEDEIEALADLIDAQGLLQNLSVVAYDLPVPGKGKDRKRLYTHGVIAGGRRLRALVQLVKRGRLTLDEEILCTVVSADRAIAVSTAENSGRVPMSAADTIVAFADMVKAGAGVEDLAVCFHLSPLTVQRRLRLANVSPSLFALFREGALTLEQLMALALTDDHEKQEAAWSAAPMYDRTPRRLRALIAGDGLSQNIVHFVGVEPYEAAGGTMLRDLFAEDADDKSYVLHPDLMMRLATEKLELIAQGLREDGVAWVETFLSLGYSEREQFIQAPTRRRQPDEREAAALASLGAEGGRLGAKLEDLYREWDSEETEDDEAIREKIDALEADASANDEKIEAIESSLREVLPEVASLVGALVGIDHNGEASITRGVMRKANAAAAKRAVVDADVAVADGGLNASAPAQPDPKAGLSDRLCHQLTAHRTRAMQAVLLSNERVALAALVHPLLTRLIYGVSGTWESPSELQAKAEDCESQLKTWAPDLVESRAEKIVQEALAAVRAMLPVQSAELLPWLLGQPIETLTQLLTLAAGLSLNAINGSGKKSQSTEALAGALGLNMADWWTPTVGSYLGAVSKAVIVQAVTEAGMPADAKALDKLKKGEAAATAETLLAGKGWLPAVLR